MPIPPINPSNTSQPRKRSFFTPVSVTGYGALILGGASAIAARKKKIKNHVYIAYAAGALALIHTALVEWRRFCKPSAIPAPDTNTNSVQVNK